METAAPRPGLFVTLEGGEGAGKSTLIRALAERLTKAAVAHVVTREPGGTPGAEAIRALLVTGAADRWSAISELCLFHAARGDHLERLIRPALARGDVVLCDRFSDSTRAYQGRAGGAGREAVEALDRLVVGETQPDLTLILDLPPETGLARAAARHDGEARFEGKAIAFHAALRAAYLALAAETPERRVVIDASRSAELVAADAWTHVRARLSAKGLHAP
jgi:dTMP kinase